VVRRGSGPIDVLLIPGWVFGADVFDAFMRANETRYRMVAVTLRRDPNAIRVSGSVLVAAALASQYGFTDVDGRQPIPLTLAEV
jgi:hypothetical protein